MDSNTLLLAAVAVIVSVMLVAFLVLRGRAKLSEPLSDADLKHEVGVEYKKGIGDDIVGAANRQAFFMMGLMGLAMAALFIPLYLLQQNILALAYAEAFGFSLGLLDLLLGFGIYIREYKKAGRHFLFLSYNPNNPDEEAVSRYLEIDGWVQLDVRELIRMIMARRQYYQRLREQLAGGIIPQ